MAPQPPLLALPAELRLNIYEYVLTLSKPSEKLRMINNYIIFEDADGPSRPLSVLTMLLTCRQIYHEAEALFYQLNHFDLKWEFHSPYDGSSSDTMPGISGFIASLNVKRLEALRAITVTISSTEAISLVLDTLKCCSGLVTLHFRTVGYAFYGLERMREGFERFYPRMVMLLPQLWWLEDFRFIPPARSMAGVPEELARWEERLRGCIEAKRVGVVTEPGPELVAALGGV